MLQLGDLEKDLCGMPLSRGPSDSQAGRATAARQSRLCAPRDPDSFPLLLFLPSCSFFLGSVMHFIQNRL